MSGELILDGIGKERFTVSTGNDKSQANKQKSVRLRPHGKSDINSRQNLHNVSRAEF